MPGKPLNRKQSKGEWTKEGLGGAGNQGLPIYSITDFEREGAGQETIGKDKALAVDVDLDLGLV